MVIVHPSKGKSYTERSYAALKDIPLTYFRTTELFLFHIFNKSIVISQF